jgi:hypothetical protein
VAAQGAGGNDDYFNAVARMMSGFRSRAVTLPVAFGGGPAESAPEHGANAIQIVGADVEKDAVMDFSQVLALVTGWVVISVPVSLMIGGFIALGSRQAAGSVRRTVDQAA